VVLLAARDCTTRLHCPNCKRWLANISGSGALLLELKCSNCRRTVFFRTASAGSVVVERELKPERSFA